MDVLLLFEYPTLQGGERSMLAVLPALKAAGIYVRAACPPVGPLSELLRKQGIAVSALILHDSQGIRRPLETCRALLGELLQTHPPDVLHANSLSMARLSGPVAQRLGIPSLGHLRDIVRLSRRAIADVNCHSRLLAVSEATRRFHVAQGLNLERTKVLYNGVNLAEFTPLPATGYLHRELGLEPSAALVGTIGQIGPRKGLDWLLVAAETVLRTWHAAHFLIVGERLSRKDESRNYQDELHRKAAQPPLAGHVHFLGWRNDIPDLLRELSLLVHPARQEPLGRVLLEAAASGCPIVATDVGGTREILDGITDLVAPDNPLALAESIAQLGLSASRRAKMACALRSRVQRIFDADECAMALSAHYVDLAKSCAV